LLVIVGTIPQFACGSIIAASKIVKCQRTGTEPLGIDGGACAKKMVVAITVASGDVHGTEQVEALIETADDVSAAGEPTEKLGEPYLVTLTKRRPVAHYPIKYIQSVNNNPYELHMKQNYDTILGGHLKFLSNGHCDGSSCGYAVDGEGVRIVDSEGICCSCKFTEQLFGKATSASKGSRGDDLNCKLFSSGQASAHCLRQDDLWYNVFSIGDPQVHSRVNVDVMQRLLPNGTRPGCLRPYAEDPAAAVFRNERMWVGSERRHAQSDDGSVLATFIGDFAPPQAPKVLSGYYLMVPEIRGMTTTAAGLHPQIVSHGIGPKSWMLVEKEQFGLDGTQCNKIGVGYTAFRHQAAICNQQFDSCLNNQPQDFWDRGDDYRLSSFGTFEMAHDETTNTRSISYTVEQVQDTLVTLSMTADGVRFIENFSPGRIILARINNFVALDGPGELAIKVENTGCIAAKFSIFVGCNRDILPLSTRESSIAANDFWEVSSPVHATNTLGGNYWCQVTLLGATGTVLDTSNVTFTTNATCICLGSCGCTCDPDARADYMIEKCVEKESTPKEDSGSAGKRRKGGFSLSGLFAKIGLSIGDVIGVALAVAAVSILVCILRRAVSCSASGQSGGGSERQVKVTVDHPSQAISVPQLPLASPRAVPLREESEKNTPAAVRTISEQPPVDMDMV
jgi:hypothetical protein